MPAIDTEEDLDDPFALDIRVVTDIGPDHPDAACDTNDGCGSTCASACASAY